MAGKFLTALATSSVLAAASLIGFPGSAEAATINGGISFTGGYQPDTGNLGTATTIDFTRNLMRAVDCNGDFASSITCDPLFGDVGTIQDLTFAPFSAISNFWNMGGFSFDLNNIVISEQTANSLKINGSGVLKNASFSDTLGSWIFTANSAGGTFSWSSSTAVPEPTSLLGIGLMGAAAVGIRRRKTTEAIEA